VPFLSPPQRREGERGNSLSFSALLAGAYTTTFLVIVTMGTPLLLCPSKIFYFFLKIGNASKVDLVCRTNLTFFKFFDTFSALFKKVVCTR
jgi:hypothetical protein